MRARKNGSLPAEVNGGSVRALRVARLFSDRAMRIAESLKSGIAIARRESAATT